MRAIIYGAIFVTLANCSGGGGGNSPTPIQPSPNPAPPVSAGPDFSAVQTQADASAAPDLAILIGDETGILFAYEKGGYDIDREVAIASASKLIFGLMIWDMVETGDLSPSDRPQSYIDFWTDISGDARAEITLDQLMAFTSGFNQPPSNPGCISDGTITLRDCVEDIYNSGVDTLPGAAYYYGPEHMQVAGLMATAATGKTIATLLRERISTPLGLLHTAYPETSGDNPRFSGQMRSSAADLATVLTAVMAADLVTDRDEYLEDRTASVVFGSRPGGLDAVDWHYGFGFWKECDALSYTAACDMNPTISSPGAFGMTPWIDFQHGYWGLVAIEALSIDGRSASIVSVELQQTVQPLIEAELD